MSHPQHDRLARYSTPIAVFAALLLMLALAARLVAVPLCLAALLADRAAARLNTWLAALPLPPQPVRVTAVRLPSTVTTAPTS